MNNGHQLMSKNNTKDASLVAAHTATWSMQNKNGYFRHGGPYDRGFADYYYSRGVTPHYYIGASYQSERIDYVGMSKEQRDQYYAGYNDAKADGCRKEWQ